MAEPHTAPPPPIHLHLIAYSEATRATVAAAGPGWLMLDNRANPRPDWFEYWPMRQYLLQQPLDEAAFYGFFSPKFSAKTGLDHAAVARFVAAHAASADVLLFSPQPDMGAFFLNVFEQGETFDAGFVAAYEQLLVHLGRPLPLRQLVMDARQVCFSNYFVARPAFWREWLRVNEALFALCEDESVQQQSQKLPQKQSQQLPQQQLPQHPPPAPLRPLFTHITSYGSGVQRKVFMMERTASLLLATQPQWRSVPHDPFGFGWSMARFREFPQEAFTSDALKRAWRDTRWPEYMQAFVAIRERFAAGAPARRAA